MSELFGASNDLLSSSSTDKPIVRAMSFEGKAIFLKKKAPKRNAEPVSSPSRSGRMGNLLDIPIHRLLDTLSYEKGDRLRKEAADPQSTEDGGLPEDQLWVDRYRPRKFTDLLGNERVARDAMAWVKQWDWCVFGRTKKGLKNPQKKDEKDAYQDEYHRPREKFLLLSGPPGLGKTTLAHVIARQAGYEVVEINASDARSGQIVDDRIRPTLEAGSTVGSSKPVLLVIDEIDGATGSGENSNTFIHKLVQLTQVKAKKKQRNGKRESGASRPLLRPIICICNDANASSIAKLRPHALQIRFNKPADIHVVKRLRDICEIEELKADSRALSTLVGVAKGDLRGCLNTLQFIKADRAEVTESIIRKATIGMKESESSIQTVLDSIFNPLSKKRVKELGLTEQDEGKYVARLYQEIDGCGRESAIATGCFGHYASLRNYDANLSRHEKAGEWLVTFDLISASMYGDADFTLAHYLPYFLVPFYPLFQERGGERVERNQADWDHLQTTRSNEEIYKSLSRGLRTAAVRHGGDFRHLGGSPIVQLEFAPLLNRIISPPLRPVNSQIIKPDEKTVLDRLVSIMTAVELRFIRERSEEGTLSYRLDPPIDVFVTYDGKRALDLPVSRYAVRHIVAAEVDAKLYDRENDVIEKGKRGKHQGVGLGARDGDDDGASGPNKKSKVEIDPADKPPTDFFGRSISVTKNQKSKPISRKGSSQVNRFRVSYKFAEGNSAAVRKPVKVGCFL
ncbi:P-loop containing nucleoside triphosphate hydrolase protein [Coprinellus micaceus]|uniref:P-loop containing nucleoside triphosphate hydrolase protein n=1 Tax=Coprinellus micaceus TaxID=71717 RepID=A0A4Y7SXG6_COPMI|nr:P-loop containing nucleoside triphosphate hydrolase protein [Coprinellus micaceus]